MSHPIILEPGYNTSGIYSFIISMFYLKSDAVDYILNTESATSTMYLQEFIKMELIDRLRHNRSIPVYYANRLRYLLMNYGFVDHKADIDKILNDTHPAELYRFVFSQKMGCQLLFERVDPKTNNADSIDFECIHIDVGSDLDTGSDLDVDADTSNAAENAYADIRNADIRNADSSDTDTCDTNDTNDTNDTSDLSDLDTHNRSDKTDTYKYGSHTSNVIDLSKLIKKWVASYIYSGVYSYRFKEIPYIVPIIINNPHKLCIDIKEAISFDAINDPVQKIFVWNFQSAIFYDTDCKYKTIVRDNDKTYVISESTIPSNTVLNPDDKDTIERIVRNIVAVFYKIK